MANRETFQIFIDDTIAAAGFKDAPEDFKEAYRERIELAFAKRMGTDLAAMLAKESLLEFNEMIEKNPTAAPETLFEFFSKHIPNIEQAIVDIMKEFQAEFIQAAKAVPGN